jgi:SMC interacting uncharacterized protein involved in chromosome segregation
MYMNYNYNTMLDRIDKISSLIKEEDYIELLNNLKCIKEKNEDLYKKDRKLKYTNTIKNYKKEIESKNEEIDILKNHISNLEYEVELSNYS